MKLIDKLKENYQNGRKEKSLLRKKKVYCSAMDNGFQGDAFYNGVVMINNQIDNIPRPGGVLERLAYSLGSRWNLGRRTDGAS